MTIDQKALANENAPYPTSKQFYQLLAQSSKTSWLVGKERQNAFPFLSITGMGKDFDLYVALLEVIAALTDHQDTDQVKKMREFANSEPMIALHNNTFAQEYENNSRLTCYRKLTQLLK